MGSATYEMSQGLGVITLSLGRGGALDAGVFAGLATCLAQVRDDGARAVLLRADGPVFAAGSDLGPLRETDATAAAAQIAEPLQVIQAVEDLGVPTIAAVQGACLGGGLELALACDLLVARAGTHFGQVEARVGGITFYGGVYRIATRCGVARAKEIAFSGDVYPASRFEEWGIVNRILPAEGFEEQARAFAAGFAAGPTAAHRVAKQLVACATADGTRAADALLLKIAPELMETDDWRNGVSALMTLGPKKFMADRSAVTFSGR